VPFIAALISAPQVGTRPGKRALGFGWASCRL
jgi:hypothetical protein